jgi:molecular chaperone HtpG
MTPAAVTALKGRDNWEPGPDEITLGVDIVELVGSSMYVEPLTVYREYVQNSADSLDDARSAGLLPESSSGRVDIEVDVQSRMARVRDNGFGVQGSDFVRRLTAFGGSDKRGRARRGFRGVGRLAALGYCQELLFRSRSSAEEPVRELRWDCRVLRSLLRSGEYKGSLGEAVKQATSHRMQRATDEPPRFFEVELRGVVRHGNDDLLNEAAIRDYLCQVAPLPFAPSFGFSRDIEAFLADIPNRAELHVFVNGVGPVYRPHSETMTMRVGLKSRATDLSLVTIPALDGGVAAKGWVLHHEYLGALPRDLNVRGLRFRSGNIQVGGETVLESVFAEPRFNLWSVGEFHVLDDRIIPNGRRDHYEQSVHLANVLNHVSPIARDIGARCRSRSQYRQLLRNADLLAGRIEDGLSVLRQGAVSIGARRALAADLRRALQRLEAISGAQLLSAKDRRTVAARRATLKRRVERAIDKRYAAPQLQRLSRAKRRVYEEVFSAIYEHAATTHVARDLVERVLRSLRERRAGG